MPINIPSMITTANHHEFVTEIEDQSETEEDDGGDIEIEDSAVTKLNECDILFNYMSDNGYNPLHM